MGLSSLHGVVLSRCIGEIVRSKSRTLLKHRPWQTGHMKIPSHIKYMEPGDITYSTANRERLAEYAKLLNIKVKLIPHASGRGYHIHCLRKIDK